MGFNVRKFLKRLIKKPIVQPKEIVVKEVIEEIQIPEYEPDSEPEIIDVVPLVRKRTKDSQLSRKVSLNPLSD
jgi:hypothetical protein